jgi:hypothetical protein
MRSNRALSLTCSSIVACSLAAQIPSSLPITYTAPKSWLLLESRDQRGATIALYKIRDNQTADGKQIPSNALITMYKLPEGVSFADADGIVASRVRDAKLIVSGQDGESWKTYVYVTSEDKQQLIILYRIGIINGIGLEAMVAFPHIASKDNKVFSVLTIKESTVQSGSMAGVFCNPSSMVETVGQFNELCSTMKISGKNQFEARAQLVDPPPDAKYYRKVEEDKK